ncbi:hypothetical protein VTK26DRAFT_49 [Humicola hyalothermophila]
MWPFSSAPVAADDKLPPTHPYYPLGVDIAHYVANDYSVLRLLISFALGCAAVFLVTHLSLLRRSPVKLSAADRLTVFWFALCGCIHLFFEGYYVAHFRSLAGLQTLFGQLWKEYSLSDSRYLTSDPFVLCMEAVTAVCWGPLSFAVACLIARDHPLRHPLQLLVSLGQLYGDVLYFATSAFDEWVYGRTYSRPERYYYWGYYVLCNIFWIVIPACLVVSSVRAGGRAAKALKQLEKGKKAA